VSDNLRQLRYRSKVLDYSLRYLSYEESEHRRFDEYLRRTGKKVSGMSPEDRQLRFDTIRARFRTEQASVQAELTMLRSSAVRDHLIPWKRLRSGPKIPGKVLAASARWLLSKKSFEQNVQPVIADMQLEHAEAIASGEIWRSRWIVLRGHMNVFPGWWYSVAWQIITRWLFGSH
jgi:hypothetical protein